MNDKKISIQGFCTPRRGQRSASVAPSALPTSAPAFRRNSSSKASKDGLGAPLSQNNSSEERLRRLSVLATPKRARKPLLFAGASPVVLTSSAASSGRFRSAILNGSRPPAFVAKASGNDWRKNLAA
jgi:hypothetical protein